MAIAVNLALTAGQIIGGIVSGSLSLIADALHNASDAGAIVVAYVARKIGRRPADAHQTFGYRRVELVGALINSTVLVVMGIYLLYEAIARMVDPNPIVGWIVVWVAVGALVIDAFTAWLTYTLSHDNLNVRAAFIHNLSDALGSVAVIVAGVAILVWDATWMDVAVTFLIAAYVLWQGIGMVRESGRILALGAPPSVDLAALVEELTALGGVRDVHHVHLWQFDEKMSSFEAHLRIEDVAIERLDRIRMRAKAVLAEHGVTHSTLEFELGATGTCSDPTPGRQDPGCGSQSSTGTVTEPR